MKPTSMLKGAAMLAVVGATAYLYNHTSPATKRKMKKNAYKAADAMESAYKRFM